ncbi:MAG: glycoside hydrolase family protein [Sedimentisphaeraceae bacterium JB056]
MDTSKTNISGQPLLIQREPVGCQDGFRMEDYWVWCGSAVRDEKGLYHLFASRWQKSLPFKPHWLTNSEIVRAQSDKPCGPYKFEEVVLGQRGQQFWDGRMTHNPTMHKYGSKYLLFYTGTTYKGKSPVSPEFVLADNNSELAVEARRNQRIGLAIADSPLGPWERFDKPVFDVSDSGWDSWMVTNPAVCINDDGSILLIYKAVSNHRDKLKLGVAKAKGLGADFVRLKQSSLFDFERIGQHVEDPYVWWEDNRYNMVMKDMNGGICGEKGGGIYAYSEDGIDWQIADNPLAYTREVAFEGGALKKLGSLERPQLFFESDGNVIMFAATADISLSQGQPKYSKNIAIKLERNNNENIVH